jgi:triosephosphate isomerase
MLKTSDTTTSLIDEKDSDEFLNTSFLKKPKNGIKRIVCVGDSLT